MSNLVLREIVATMGLDFDESHCQSPIEVGQATFDAFESNIKKTRAQNRPVRAVK